MLGCHPALLFITAMLKVGMSLCVTAAVLITGSTGSVCHTAVESLDLGCLLRWDCPHASPNATYTVQTKTQGGPWRDVEWCVRISSRRCDVTLVFSDFEVYNMIRVGVRLGPGATVWTEPRKFDYSDLTFSPPSVSVSLDGDRLAAQVQFPCAASRRCSQGRCCPVSELIDPWTTVTLYNQLNDSDHQSRTVWTQEILSYVEFSGLAPGQNYCAVANFSFPSFIMAASPKSRPQCVQTAPESGILLVFMGVGLCSLFIFPLILLFLFKKRKCALTNENQPKTVAPPQDPVSLVPLSAVPADPSDIHLELLDDSSSSPSQQDQGSHQGDGYSSNSLRCDSM